MEKSFGFFYEFAYLESLIIQLIYMDSITISSKMLAFTFCDQKMRKSVFFFLHKITKGVY